MRNLKKVLALVLAMAMALSLAVTAGAATLGDYSDSEQVTAKYATAVDFASQLGILEGMGNGKYAPQGTLTRAQLATMVYRMTTADVNDVYSPNFAGGAAEAFSDTPADAWYAGYVGYAADNELLKGLGDGTYAPDEALTGYAALAAFLRGVGYDEPGHNFVGPDWTLDVTQVAKQACALEGITGVDLNKPITREVAAQMIFNIMFAGMVAYTPAFGYQPDISFDLKDLAIGDVKTLAKTEFDLVEGKKGDFDAVTAPWGQPAIEWTTIEDGDVAVSIPYAPVAKYTTAVSECQIAKDLGLTKDAGVVEWFINGEDMASFDETINLTDTAKKIGDQGTLTEVYKVDGKYWFVQIETWLGQITDVTAATYDSLGHERAPATVDLKVWNADNQFAMAYDVKATGFAKEDYVLINYSEMLKDGKEIGHILSKTAPVATAAELTMKGVGTDATASTVGGKTYDWAAHYHAGNPGFLETKYDVFVDFYGNLIGLFEYVADPVYTILDKGAWASIGLDSFVEGEIVNLTTGALERIEIAEYFDKHGSNTELDSVAFTNWAEEGNDMHDIVKYEVTEDGYEMKQVGNQSYGYYIKNGAANIVVGNKLMGVDANTIFAVETECGKAYDIYVGYENVPTMTASNARIETFNEDTTDNFLDIVYVNATAATIYGEDVVAYVTPQSTVGNAGVLANGVKYVTFSNVVVNGELVDVMCAENFNLSVDKGYVMTLKVNSDGLVCDAEGIEGFWQDVTVGSVSGNTFAVGGLNYIVDKDTTIWVVDYDEYEVTTSASVGSMDDIEEGATILFMSTEGVADTIIVKK